MKTIILIVTTIVIGSLNFSVNAQINNLSQSEYFNLRYDGVSVVDISSTNGDTNKMQVLFNNSLVVEKGFNDGVEHWIKFAKNSLCIEFYNGVQEGSKITYDLASINIENNTSNILIKSKKIKIGDNQSLLSSFKSRNAEGQKVFTFSTNSIDEYAYVYVNISTGKVVKIGYDGNLF